VDSGFSHGPEGGSLAICFRQRCCWRSNTMALTTCKRLLILLTFLSVGLIGFTWRLRWKHNSERLDTKAAWNVIMDSDRIRSRLNTTAIPPAATYLEAITPANLNTWNRYLRKILERDRDRLVLDSIEDLRKRTGEDLEDHPEKWIQRYRPSPTELAAA